MTDTTQPHPEPSEEASSLPVVAWLHKVVYTNGHRGTYLDSEEHAPHIDRESQRSVEDVALTPLADAQSQLNAMRVERDAALAKLQEFALQALVDDAQEMGLYEAPKAAPVVDVEAILRLAEKMMRDSWATGEDSAWHPARDELRAALASPEGNQHD